MSREAHREKMANTAMVLGIIALVSAVLQTVILPFIFFGLSLTFAFLSRSGDGKFLKKSKIGISVAVVGLVTNLFIIVAAITVIRNNPDILMETARTYEQIYEQMYGESFEETYGENIEDILEEMFHTDKLMDGIV